LAQIEILYALEDQRKGREKKQIDAQLCLG